MSMNTAPKSERVHIGIFGRANAGKSSVINALTGQDVSIVSPVKGTTTDPVDKAMELLPIGPVLLFDTPGLDDDTALGQMRVARARDILKKCNVALLVADANIEPSEVELDFLDQAKHALLQTLLVLNKSDLGTSAAPAWDALSSSRQIPALYVSAVTSKGIHELKEALSKLKPSHNERILVRDLIKKSDICVLVVPIDEAAPKGRLILPQQQVIRDLMEGGAMALVTKDTEYQQALAGLSKKPALVITDSQAFGKISKLTPPDIPLTSFSILFARYKGDLDALLEGASAVDSLAEGDSVLISEGCTHHRQCGDIGTVKIPKWLEAHTGHKLNFTFTSGGSFPEDLSPYKLVVHCGGCMLNEKEMARRIGDTRGADKPIVNYGMLIAHVNGILKRATAPLTK